MPEQYKPKIDITSGPDRSYELEMESALRLIESKQKEAIEMIKRNGFVFQTPLGKQELSEVERWEKLAFTLYTEICEISHIARQALEIDIEELSDDPIR